jgi:hypothetical protein
MTCRCHSSDLYRGLIDCPKCGHRSYDPGVGCERRACGHVESAKSEAPGS